MNSKAQKLPEIRQDVNKEKKEDKRGGLWWSLLSRLGLGPAPQGFEAISLSSVGLSSGLLATKAGIIGLILAGSTVAGSIGLVGYKIFGPGSGGLDTRFTSLFQPRPKENSEVVGPASKDGNSVSLDYLVKANEGANDDEAAKAETSAQARDAFSGDTVGGRTPDNNAVPGGQANLALKLNSAKKIGQLNKLVGGDQSVFAGATLAAASPQAAASVAGGSKLGTPKAFSVSKGRPAITARRSLSAMKSSNSFMQLGAVRADHVAAASSAQAGHTYDGAAPAGTIGPDAGIPGGSGAAIGGKGTSVAPTPSNSVPDRYPKPPQPDAKNVTPWQAAIDTAAMLVVAASLLLMLAAKVAKHPAGQAVPMMAYALAALAAILGLAAMAFGSMVAGGKYGQAFQGNMFVLSGGLIVATAGAAAMGFNDPKSSMATQGKPTMIMMLSGAAALGAAMAGYLIAPKHFPASQFKMGLPPDWDHQAQGKMLSEEALERLAA